jgi:hypothetical protein
LSAYVRYSFLGLCFNQTCRLSWKLQHRSLLPLENVRQEHDLPVWKLKGIVMGPRLILVDLPKHGRGVADRPPAKREPAARMCQGGCGNVSRSQG